MVDILGMFRGAYNVTRMDANRRGRSTVTGDGETGTQETGDRSGSSLQTTVRCLAGVTYIDTNERDDDEVRDGRGCRGYRVWCEQETEKR